MRSVESVAGVATSWPQGATLTEVSEEKTIGYQRDGRTHCSVVQAKGSFSDGSQATIYGVRQAGTKIQWQANMPRIDYYMLSAAQAS